MIRKEILEEMLNQCEIERDELLCERLANSINWSDYDEPLGFIRGQISVLKALINLKERGVI